ncbi:MAG: hypothetical protein QM731_06965 [Chitinophagaceae bacterium]
MKALLLILLTTFFSSIAFTQQEDAVIKDILQKETTAFFNHDFKTSYSYWYIKPQSLAIVSESDGKVLQLTSKELNAIYTASSLKTAVFPKEFKRSDWRFQIKGDAAYVTFEQTASSDNEMIGRTYESRYLEKINGQWKIISMTVVNFKK